MNSRIVEQIISCPYCAESSSVVLDLSAGSQIYIEDCQMCCRPIEIGFDSDDGDVCNLRVERAV